MRSHWMAAVLLGSALAAGCGGADDNARTTEEAAPGAEAPAPTEQAVEPEPAPPAEEPGAVAGRADTSSARPPSGNRTAAQPRTSTPPRPSSAAPAPREEAPPARRVEEPPARPVVRTLTIPAGTAVPLELTTALSSETARVEAPISARLRDDIVVNGRTAIPAGSVFEGEVIDVERAGRVQGRARLGLRFTSVTIGNTRESLRTNPLTFEGEATKGEDATKVGAGAGIGAVIGGILGGGSGAAKGAAIGGAAGAGTVLATRGREVELPTGSNLNATLATEIDVVAR